MRRCAYTMLVLTTLVASSSCALFREETSPAQYGLALHVAPGFPVGDAGVTVHPTAAYTRPLSGGTDGEQDNVLRLGAQVRVPVGAPEAGWWMGAETTYGRRWTSFELSGIPSTGTNGWAIAAMAGRPVVENDLGAFHGYVAAGVLKWGGSGPYVRFGVDLQPAFLKR